jgi:hypothetical protein
MTTLTRTVSRRAQGSPCGRIEIRPTVRGPGSVARGPASVADAPGSLTSALLEVAVDAAGDDASDQQHEAGDEERGEHGVGRRGLTRGEPRWVDRSQRRMCCQHVTYQFASLAGQFELSPTGSGAETGPPQGAVNLAQSIPWRAAAEAAGWPIHSMFAGNSAGSAATGGIPKVRPAVCRCNVWTVARPGWESVFPGERQLIVRTESIRFRMPESPGAKWGMP